MADDRDNKGWLSEDNYNVLYGGMGFGDDRLEGNIHNDILIGGYGLDTINGGDGDDRIWGDGYLKFTGVIGTRGRQISASNDQLYADLMADVIDAGLGNDWVHGGGGDDSIDSGEGQNTVYGSYGSDTIIAGDQADTIYGGNNEDDFGIDGDDDITAGGGDDRVYGEGGNDTIDGGTGNDDLTGQAGNDTIYGGDGNDRIWGGVGNDTITGDNGSDQIEGGFGNDILTGGQGNDTIYGQEEDDTIDGGTGNDTIDGGTGNDTITDLDGDNTIIGGSGDDVITAGAGNDDITSGAGDDTVAAGDGDNIIDTGSGHDVVSSGTGADNIDTADGDDTITAGGGDDVIDAGTGADTITGGAGRDHFIFGYDDFLDGYVDVIKDFEVGQLGDLLDLSDIHEKSLADGFGDAWAGAEWAHHHGYIGLSVEGDDTLVSYDQDGLYGDWSGVTFLRLEGVQLTSLSSHNVDPAPSDKLYMIEPADTLSEDSGAAVSYRVVLGREPTSDVSVQIAGGDQIYVNGSSDPITLTFTQDNWFQSQHVSVTAIDDLVIERDHTAPLTHTFSSSDERFEGITEDLSVLIRDNDFQRSFSEDQEKLPSDGNNRIIYDLDLSANGQFYTHRMTDLKHLSRCL